MLDKKFLVVATSMHLVSCDVIGKVNAKDQSSNEVSGNLAYKLQASHKKDDKQLLYLKGTGYT